jgi:hypothetical protein
MKRLKIILRDTGFVGNATLQIPSLMAAYAVNAIKTLSMTPRRLISHLRSRHPKKKKLSLIKFNSKLAQIIAPGHVRSATLKNNS